MKHISLVFVVLLLISSLTLTANSPPQPDDQDSQISAVMLDQNLQLFSQGVMVVPTMLWFTASSQEIELPTIMATARSGTTSSNFTLLMSDEFINTSKVGDNAFKAKKAEAGTSSLQIVYKSLPVYKV